MTCRRPLRRTTLLATLMLAACGQVQTETGAGSTTLTEPSPPIQATAPTSSIVPVDVAPFLRGESPSTANAVHLTASGHRFNVAVILRKAGETHDVLFENADAGDLHNLAVMAKNPSKVVFRGASVTGVATGTYGLPTLTPGVYSGVCDVHPIFMVGTLEVV